MASARRKVPTHMTADEFMAWPGDGEGGKYQLVDGELRAMSPASTTHSKIQTSLGRRIDAHLDVGTNKCSAHTEPAIEVRVNAKSNMRVPDLAVSCAPDAPGQTILPDPILLIEIMSPGNAHKTMENVWAYTTIPSVKEILVVQSTRLEVEVWRRQPDASWPATAEKITGDAVVHLASIGLTISLREIYAKTHLA